MNLLILDTETTCGGETPKTEPVKIAFRLLKETGEPTNHVFNMKPDLPCLASATVIHGMEQNIIDRFPPAHEQLQQIWDLFLTCSSEVVVAAYNASFDVYVVNMAFQKYIKKKFEPKRVLDVYRLAQKMINAKEAGNLRLDTVYYKLYPDKLTYLLRQRQTHSALNDVNLTEEVLMELWDRFEKQQKSKITLNDLIEYCRAPMMIEDWPFGKHKDDPIDDVLRRDAQYVSWFMEKCDFRDQHQDLVYTIRQKRKI